MLSAVALFGLYLLLSFGNDTRAFLGTDTGGKVATLRVMKAHHTTDPDVGYWAETWYRFRKTARRHKAAVTTAALVATALVLGLVGTTLGLVQARWAEEATAPFAAATHSVRWPSSTAGRISGAAT